MKPSDYGLTGQEARILREEIKILGLKCWDCKHWPGQGEKIRNCNIKSPSFPLVGICYDEPESKNKK